MTELSIGQKCALDSNNDSLVVASNANENEIAKFEGASAESILQSTVNEPGEPNEPTEGASEYIYEQFNE